MKALRFILGIFFLQSIIYCAVLAPDKSLFPDRFSVFGNKIVDSRQQEVVFRGISAMDPIYHYFNGDDIVWGEDYYNRIKDWGADIIRLPIHPYYWREYGKEKCLQILDKVIDWAEKNKVYVYIDFHSIGFPPAEDYDGNFDGIYLTSVDETSGFWETIAEKYKNNPVVAFYEIFNEPVYAGFCFSEDGRSTPADWLAWKQVAEDLTKIIRRHDEHKPIIIGGMYWAYDLSQALKDPLSDKNIIYAAHPYPGSSQYKSWDDAFGKIKEKYPVFVTEFGFEREGQKAENTYTGRGRYRDDIYNYLESRKISWTAWCFSDKWSPSLLKDKNYNPTEAGEFFRAQLRR
ncbi:MAG: glycoside hydrolase family 5 protein [Candidatus Margulisbacteria bacterium]|nr:glycoside hydrolase family 5 protein [Candidatus Margulisiibacteriota bacterium]